MAASSRRHPLYLLFLLLMALVCAAGVALVIYGSLNNGIPVPKVPGRPVISWYGHG